MGHNHAHPGDLKSAREGNFNDVRYRETIRVTLIGAVIDLVLGAVKIFVGLAAQSQALIADGIHSLSDLATDGLVLYAAKHSSRDADEKHPYGHGRVETAVTVCLGVALIGVAVGISVDAVSRLFHPEELWVPGVWALVVAAVSIVAKEGIYQYTMRVARKHRSNMLRANAWHSRSDAISSIIVVVGVAGSMAGLTYLDAIAAIGVGVMIVKIGWDLAWRSLQELMDTGLAAERVAAIRQSILNVHGVDALHILRTRCMGADAFVDVHIQVDPQLSLSEAHHISETVRSRLIKEIDEVADVMVHIDPEDDELYLSIEKLPLREEILKKLQHHWANIDSSGKIEKITLHYLKGKVHVDLFFPLSILHNAGAQTHEQMVEEYNKVAQAIEEIEQIQLYFH